MTATPRDISPEMQPLYDRLDELCRLVDGFVQGVVGERRGVLVIVQPPEPGKAALTVHNFQTHEMAAEVMRDFLKNAGSGADE